MLWSRHGPEPTFHGDTQPARGAPEHAELLVQSDGILGLLRRDVRIDRSDGFAWPPHLSRRSWRGYRVSDDPTSRPLQHIPLVEIANAMYATRQRLELRWDSEELLRATLAEFGAKRLTDGVWSRLVEARRLARRLDG